MNAHAHQSARQPHCIERARVLQAEKATLAKQAGGGGDGRKGEKEEYAQVRAVVRTQLLHVLPSCQTRLLRQQQDLPRRRAVAQACISTRPVKAYGQRADLSVRDAQY